MIGVRKITANIAWLASEYAFKMLGGICIVSLMARTLGVESYGEFQYALGLVTIFMAFSYVCGAEVLVPKLVSADHKTRVDLLSAAFFLRMFFSALAYFFLVFYLSLFESSAVRRVAVVLGFVIFLNEPFGVVIALLQAKVEIKPKALAASVATLAKAGLVLIFYWASFDSPWMYAWAWVLESLIIACALIYIYRVRYSTSFFFVGVKSSAKLLSEGFPFLMGSLAAYSFLRLDVVLLKHFGSPVDLGIYSTAIQLLSVLTAFAPILVMSMASSMVYAQESLLMVKWNICKIATIMILFSLFGAFFLNLLSPIILPKMFGNSYSEVVPVLKWLSVSSVFLFLDAALNSFFIKVRRGSLITYKWIFATAASGIVHWLFIPKFGSYGAIAGFATGYFVACLYNIIIIILIKDSFQNN